MSYIFFNIFSFTNNRTQVTDNTACWSFKSGEGGTQFPTSAAAAMSLLSFDASSMEADKIYEFTLVVSKQTRTASTSVMVTALNGDPPKVGFMFPIDLMHMMSDEWGALT